MRALLLLLTWVGLSGCGESHVLPCFCLTETEGEETTSTDGDTTGLPEPRPMPDGSPCTIDAECLGNCRIVPILGGICGECAEDSDCANGCTGPDPLREVGSVCNEGAFGDGCETQEACADDLECADVVELAGLIDISACSTCSADWQCAEDERCGPSDALWALFNPGGLQCIPLWTISTGGACAPGSESGDNVCETGICSTVDVMGLGELGVCSDCRDGGDCPGSSCEPAVYDIVSRTVTPARCG